MLFFSCKHRYISPVSVSLQCRLYAHEIDVSPVSNFWGIIWCCVYFILCKLINTLPLRMGQSRHPSVHWKENSWIQSLPLWVNKVFDMFRESELSLNSRQSHQFQFTADLNYCLTNPLFFFIYLSYPFLLSALKLCLVFSYSVTHTAPTQTQALALNSLVFSSVFSCFFCGHCFCKVLSVTPVC